MSWIDLARHTTAQLLLVSPPRRRGACAEGFYLPPDPLPPGQPGELIRAEPMDAYLVPGVRLRCARVADPLPLDRRDRRTDGGVGHRAASRSRLDPGTGR